MPDDDADLKRDILEWEALIENDSGEGGGLIMVSTCAFASIVQCSIEEARRRLEESSDAERLVVDGEEYEDTWMISR